MIIKKLRKNSGITIIHALVSVLIFAVFSSIVLSATATNLKSFSTQIEYQQAYLSVSNVAELFVDSIEGDQVYVEKIVGINGDVKSDPMIQNSTWEYKDTGLANLIYTTEDATNTGFFSMLKRSIGNNTNNKAYNTYKIKTTVGSATNPDFATEIIMEIAIENQGTLYCNFYINPDPALGYVKNNDNYFMRLEIPMNKVDLRKAKEYETFKESIEISGATYSKYRLEKYLISFDTSNITVEKGKFNYGNIEIETQG